MAGNFTDDIYKDIYLDEKTCLVLSDGTISNNLALVQTIPLTNVDQHIWRHMVSLSLKI